MALEATTGWRFLVEELRAARAVVHLAEPAETAALRGNKKRAKSDRADARHHRELLLAGRLPESWIPPDHILDLRARVRLRHTLIEQHGEWQQRIQAVLYHHGCPHRRQLMVGDGREWLAAQPLPETARQQITVAVAIIDALEREIAPVTRELRSYARRQTGCKALIEAYYGIGELCAVTVVSELGDCRRFANSRDAVRYGGLDVTVYQSDRHRAPGHLSRQGPPALRWALYRPRRSPVTHARPIAPTTSRPPSAWAATAHVSRSRASCSSAAITHCASSAMTPSRHPSRRVQAQVAQPRAARQAAAPAAPSLRQPNSPRMLSPLDPGSGCAVWQRAPAMPDLPTTTTTFHLPSRASSPHSHRCAAAGSSSPAADTLLAWTA